MLNPNGDATTVNRIICVTSPRCDGFAGQVGGNAGDRVERIPVTEAIRRKVAVAAASGNTRAQQNYLNLLMGAEADRRVATMEFLKAAVDYKKHWHQVLAERARTGTTGPEPVPHPDDVLIDYEWKYPDRWPGHGGPKAGAGSVARHVAKARTRVDGNQHGDRL
jgi:hypothetical protein